jgi:hypothetical protein
MPVNVTINISDSPGSGESTSAAGGHLDTLREEVKALRELFADDIGPFPPAGIDGFLSHFVIAIRFLRGEQQGQLVAFTLQPAVQTVARSAPFLYQGAQKHQIRVPVPQSSTLPDTINEDLFLAKSPKFFIPGKEQVWLQILNLDARGETSFGPIRIILGETLKRDYPDLFYPSLGLAQSIGRAGFPARFFFSPVGVFETPLGAFRTRPKILEARRIVEIPPIGSVSINETIQLDSVEDLRAAGGPQEARNVSPVAELVGLAHPIDAALRIPGEEAFASVDQRIGPHTSGAAAAPRPRRSP